LRVVVVGAGLSGLFTACDLIARGVDDVVVVDRSDKPGGVTKTIVRDGFMLEPGAGSFVLPHPDLGHLLNLVDAGVTPAPPAVSVRYLYIDGRLIELPASPKALLAPVLPVAAKLRALSEPLIRSKTSGDESLLSFCQRRFGTRAGDLISWMMASGVFAGDPRRLSVRSAFSTLTDLEDHGGSVIGGAIKKRRGRTGPRPAAHLPVGGMSAVVGSAAAVLGDRLHTGFKVESLHEAGGHWVVEGPGSLTADAVVVATDPSQASRILGGDLGARLAGAPTAPVAVVGLGGSEDGARIPQGFGALVGAGESMVTRGVLFESSYAPDRAPDGSWLMKVIAGGATNPDVVEWEETRLVDRLVLESSRIVGSELVPTFVEVARHLPGIPQYDAGHHRWLHGLQSLVEARPGLALTGWGYRGVGVAQLASDARAVARSLVG
jgi:oxygen-dependent protoporphyrinogen oxidase